MAPAQKTRLGPAVRSDQRKHDGDEGEPSDLDPDIEEEQRNRQHRLRDSEGCQRTGESQTVQETECEGDDPGIVGRQPGLVALQLHHLDADEDDAQRNRRVKRVLAL